MSKSTRGIRAAGVASLAVTLSIGVAAPAFAAPGFEFTRVSGDDRYETAVAAAEIYGASDEVILANGQPGEYADALAGNYLAGAADAPILLTKRKELPASTKAQIDDIDPATIWVVGGTSAVPAEQVAELEADGYNVERISGSDRFGTNAEVIAQGGDSAGGVGLIATGLNFPDALAAGPFAYQGHSLGLVRTNSVPDVVGDALEEDGVTSVLIFGGEGAVGAGVVSDLAARGITVEERFAGSDRSETSKLAAEWALENLDFTDEHVGVASGYTDGYGADALAGGPVEGNENSPMLITRNVDNPDDVIDYLEAHSDTLGDGHIYGGSAAISDAAEAEMTAAATGEEMTNQDFVVSPEGDQSNTADSDDETDNVSYTVTGITSSTVDIALIPCENVTENENGVVSFADEENQAGTDETTLEGNNEADLGDVAAEFISVNGSAPGTGAGDSVDYQNDVGVVNGSVNFTFDSAELECVRAVIFDDANDDNALDLDANNQPTEAFSVTGEVTFVAAAAESGEMDENVESNDEANNTFVGCEITGDNTGTGDEAVDSTDCATFSYDSNDRFYADSEAPANQLTLAEFEAQLSPGDDVSGTYLANPELQSTFILDNEAPAAPEVTASQTTGAEDTSVTLEIAEPATGEPDSYEIYQAEGTCAESTFPGEFTQIATIDGDETEYVVTGLDPETTYCFAVVAVDQGDESEEDTAEETTAAEATADEDGPLALDTELTTNGGFANRIDSGDVIKVCFNEALAAPTAGDAVELTDTDGDVGTLTNGGNATFALGSATTTDVSEGDDALAPCAANQTLVITITGPVPAAGGDDVLEVPADVTDQAGITDVAGNLWDVNAADQDVTVDVEGAEPAL